MLSFFRASRLASCLVKASLVCAVLPEMSFEKAGHLQVRQPQNEHRWSQSGKESLMRREAWGRRRRKFQEEEKECEAWCGAPGGEAKEVECSYFSCMTCDFCQACFDRELPDDSGYSDCAHANQEDPEFCKHEDTASFAKLICPKTCDYCNDASDPKFLLAAKGQACPEGYGAIHDKTTCAEAFTAVLSDPAQRAGRGLSSVIGQREVNAIESKPQDDDDFPYGCYLWARHLSRPEARLNTNEGGARNPQAMSYCQKGAAQNIGTTGQGAPTASASAKQDASLSIIPTGSTQFALVVEAAGRVLQSKIVVCEVILDNVEMENIGPLADVSFLVQPESGDVGRLTDNAFWNAEADPDDRCVSWDSANVGKRLLVFTFTEPNYIVAARVFTTRRSAFGHECYIEALGTGAQDWRQVLNTDMDMGLTVEYDAQASALVPEGGNPACQSCMQKKGFTMPPTGKVPTDSERFKSNITNETLAKLKYPPGAPGKPGEDGQTPKEPSLPTQLLIPIYVIFNTLVSVGCYMQFKTKLKQKQQATMLQDAAMQNEQDAKSDGMSDDVRL